MPIFLSFIDHVRANVSSVCPVRMSSQSFDLVVEYDIDVIGGSLRDAMGIDRLVAFFASEPISIAQHMPPKDTCICVFIPWLSSKLLESRTTLVHLRLRSLDAVRSCLPSSP